MKALVLILGLAITGTAFAAETGNPEAPKAAKTGAHASKELQALVKSLTPNQSEKLMTTLNKGSEKDLVTLPGIGKAKAKLVMGARPLKSPLDLLGIEGIGESTVREMVLSVKPRKKV
jgi:DNA uptake protein ComE-like DNA-binding protein